MSKLLTGTVYINILCSLDLGHAKMCILFINESISSLAYVDMLLMVGFFFFIESMQVTWIGMTF